MNGKPENAKRSGGVMSNIPAETLEANAFVRGVVTTEEDARKNIRAFVGELLKNAPAAKLLFNVCYKRSMVDSDVIDSAAYNLEFDENYVAQKDAQGKARKTPIPRTHAGSPHSYWVGDAYSQAIQKGIDAYRIAIEETHRLGGEAWFDLRMNDHHNANDPNFNSQLGYSAQYAPKGPEGFAGRTYLDYTNPVVSEYYKRYIKELCENYDLDGIEFDYQRSTPIMPSPVTEENILKMNQYQKDLRQIVNASGKKIQIAARVLADEKAAVHDAGLDAAQWIADGSIDVVVVSGWYIPTYYGIDIQDWRAKIDARNTAHHPYEIYAGADYATRCDSTLGEGYIIWATAEQLRGFADRCYSEGTDGIYLFNLSDVFDHNVGLSINSSPRMAISEEGEPTLLDNHDIFLDIYKGITSKEAAETGLRSYVNSTVDYANDLYPIRLSGGGSYQFTMNTGTKPAGGYYVVAVGVSDEPGYLEDLLSVSVNGTPATQIGDMPQRKGFLWQKHGKDREPVAMNESETAPRMMQFEVPLSAVTDGRNEITITNHDPREQAVKWLGLRVDATPGARPLEKKAD